MSTSEEYLEELLKSVAASEPKEAEPVIEEPIIEEPVIEEPVIEEPVIEEPIIEEPLFEEPVVEEPIIEEPLFEEPVIEEPVIEEPIIEEPLFEEPVIEEPVIEESLFEEPVIEEPIIEEPLFEETVIEEPIIEESIFEEPLIEEPIIEEPTFEESTIEEPVIEEPVIEESMMEEPVTEESVFEDELPELMPEDLPPVEDGDIIEDEDISNLLASLGELDTVSQPVEGQEIAIDPEDLASMAEALNIKELESEEQSEGQTGEDVTELLDQLSDDSELSEINELLKKNDNNEAVEDDDMLAMLEQAVSGEGAGGDDIFAIEEPLPEDEEEEAETEHSDRKHKREKKRRSKKEKGAKEENPDKKPGFFARFLNSLTEEEMSEESSEEVKNLFGEVTTAETLESADAASQELLEELEEEDKGKKSKKGKKEKQPKEKKPKEKKPKKVKVPKAEKPAGKKLPKKNIIVIAVMCASIGALMIMIAYFYPYYQDMRKAEQCYQNQEYEAAYECLIGHHLNDEEQALYEKTMLLLRLDRKYQSYLNYTAIGMDMEAFNALLQGMEAADTYLEKAEVLGIVQEYRTLAQQIEDMLATQYEVSPEQAREWLAIEDPQIYSRTLSDYLLGTNTMNLQTSDGKPYQPEEQDAEQEIQEQPDNPLIAGEESEFAEDMTDAPLPEKPTDGGAQLQSEDGGAELPTDGGESQPLEEPHVVDSIQSEPPAEDTGEESQGGRSTQNVDELFENSTIQIQ